MNMLTIIPTLSLMKAVTDKNIVGNKSDEKRICFNNIVDIKTVCEVDLILEGNIFNRIKARLTEEHIVVYNEIFKIDNSSVDLKDYNIFGAIRFIAKRESLNRKVIIIVDSPDDYTDSEIAINKNIKLLTSKEFNIFYTKFVEIKADINSSFSKMDINKEMSYILSKQLLTQYFSNILFDGS